MTSWHTLEPVDATFFRTAPVLQRFPVKLAVAPERVWDSLASERSVADWGTGIRSLTWTSPRPYGVGTTREVVLAGGVVALREEFFRWDEGRGYSFHVRESSRGGLTRFAEDYEVVPDGTGTLFTWTIALDASPRLIAVLRRSGPLSRAAFAQFPRSARKYFAEHA